MLLLRGIAYERDGNESKFKTKRFIFILFFKFFYFFCWSVAEISNSTFSNNELEFIVAVEVVSDPKLHHQSHSLALEGGAGLSVSLGSVVRGFFFFFGSTTIKRLYSTFLKIVFIFEFELFNLFVNCLFEIFKKKSILKFKLYFSNSKFSLYTLFKTFKFKILNSLFKNFQIRNSQFSIRKFSN